MQIKKRTGGSEPFRLAKLQRVLDEAARGLPGVDVDALAVDVEVGLFGRGEIEENGIQEQILQAWSAQRGKRPSPRVKCTQNVEHATGEDEQGRWQTKVNSVMPEMECHPTRGFVDVEQIRPRTNRR